MVASPPTCVDGEREGAGERWPSVASTSGSPSRARPSIAAAPTLRRGEALLDRATVLLDVLGDEAVDQCSLLGVEAAARGQQLVERPRLVASPRAGRPAGAGPGR